MSALFDRLEVKPWGLFGGKEGMNSKLLIRKKGDERWRTFAEVYGRPSANKFTNALVTRSDLIQIMTPGGGGFGDPLDRSAALVLEDVKEGYVSPYSARRDYGVVLEPTGRGLQVDEESTRQERERQRSLRPEPLPVYDWWPDESEQAAQDQLIGRRARGA